jgi:hypothetical protein
LGDAAADRALSAFYDFADTRGARFYLNSPPKIEHIADRGTSVALIVDRQGLGGYEFRIEKETGRIAYREMTVKMFGNRTPTSAWRQV